MTMIIGRKCSKIKSGSGRNAYLISKNTWTITKVITNIIVREESGKFRRRELSIKFWKS